ncbi:hypothetical protein [Jannaschia sp. W003]|uniref:hypothetical protein n=1 Tax=Jannaschia sp. W003 TaxID=2867012 RepID=UPI0021A3E3BC|nr:hypothetical protein [Jannaschia sp. W003]UWQ21329.1 hypothetical protein K3554_15380 [Jannaschia sp. W003]
MRLLMCCAAALVAGACAPAIPDSGASARRAAPPETVTAVPPPASGPIARAVAEEDAEAARLAADTRAALGAPERDVASAAPVAAPAPLPVPSAAPASGATGAAGISREQDFGAVAGARSIEEDAARLAALRARRAEMEVSAADVDLTRPETTAPNVAAYALRGARPVGNQGWSRGPFASANAAARRCARYVNGDAAQAAFLGAGGPERDRLGLDPDGDGNACGWDPAGYRAIVRGG